uniref:Uncharacterized protein n=1 Tax=Oryza rufipogon TaxID=4529 RepID=A0A0E0PUU4_ORYRU
CRKIGGGRSGNDATSLVSEKTRVRFGAAAQNGSRREEERDVWGYLLASRGSVGSFGVVAATAALEKGEKGGWIWRKRKRRRWEEVGTNRGCRRAPLLPCRRVSQLQLPPPGAGRRRVAGHRRGAAALLSPASPAGLPPLASPRKRDEEKEEGD